MNGHPEPPEIEELERAAAAHLRRFDADPENSASASAAQRLDAIADDLRRNPHTAIWTELNALTNWLAESDAISDYADLAAAYRSRIGVTEHPPDGAAYLFGLLAIARSLV